MGISMKNKCVKFWNHWLYTVKVLALRKKFEIPTDNHIDTKPTYTISFASEAKNMDGGTYRCPNYSLSMLVTPSPDPDTMACGIHSFFRIENWNFCKFYLWDACHQAAISSLPLYASKACSKDVTSLVFKTQERKINPTEYLEIKFTQEHQDDD